MNTTAKIILAVATIEIVLTFAWLLFATAMTASMYMRLLASGLLLVTLPAVAWACFWLKIRRAYGALLLAVAGLGMLVLADFTPADTGAPVWFVHLTGGLSRPCVPNGTLQVQHCLFAVLMGLLGAVIARAGQHGRTDVRMATKTLGLLIAFLGFALLIGLAMAR